MSTDAHTHTWTLPGLEVTEVTLPVPLDHADPASVTLDLFARIYADPDGTDRPYLVYLQGGPGSEAPRSVGPDSPPWLARALREHRVVMLDQRGTGRSAPLQCKDPEDETLAEQSEPDRQLRLVAACKAELLIKLSRMGAHVAEVPVTLDWAKREGESKLRVLPTMAGYARMMTRQVASRRGSA